MQELGYAQCVYSACGISFLSQSGMTSHHKTCLGQANPGDFVECEVCRVKFKTYKSMSSHMSKKHDLAPQANNPAQNDQQDVTSSTSSVNVSTYSEATKANNERIMAESKLISSPRKRGRPPVNNQGHKKGQKSEGENLLRYRDTFDLLEDPQLRPILSQQTPQQLFMKRHNIANNQGQLSSSLSFNAVQ